MASVSTPQATGDKLPKVADVIEKLGFGPFLIKETLLGASIWLAAGAQLIIVSAITKEIAQDWSLNKWERSSIVSVLFVGIMLGNFASGPCSDIVGRRLPIIISFATVVIFSLAGAAAPGFGVLFSLRLLLGCAFGFAQPAWTTLCTEITPSSWRIPMSVASSTLFVVGEIYGGLFVWLDDPHMKELDWKALTIIGTLPAAVMGLLCLLFLNESASWLASRGSVEKAMTIVKSIQWWNQKEHESIEFSAPVLEKSEGAVDAIRQQMAVATGRILRFTTVVLCLSCFVLNFVYYGSFYSFPLVLGEVDMGVSPAMALILGALWELPGYIGALLFDVICGRRVATLSYLGLMVISIIFFVEGAKQQRAGNTKAELVLHAGYAGMKCWINMGFCIVYQYASEIYPTSARVAGTGLCFGCGRIGSMAAPFMFEWVMSSTGDSWEVFFYVMASCCLFNSILVLLLPFETSGMTLKDRVEEMGEMKPLVSWPCREDKPLGREGLLTP